MIPNAEELLIKVSARKAEYEKTLFEKRVAAASQWVRTAIEHGLNDPSLKERFITIEAGDDPVVVLAAANLILKGTGYKASMTSGGWSGSILKVSF